MGFTYTIQALKSDIINSLHGTTANKLQGFNQVIQRAGSELLLEIDPQETKRITQLASPIFNQVYDYTLPVDLKGTKIIDIRPQANRTYLDRYLNGYNQTFDINKSYTLQPNFTIQYNTGVKTIRIDNNLITNGILLNQADGLSDNGTWTGTGGATNLRQDNLQFVTGAQSSVEFDTLAGQSTATLTNSTMTANDLTTHLLQSQIFFWTYLPTAANVTSVEIRWGSDTSNYWSQVLTTTQSGTAFANGWNLLQATWSTATKVGNPNVAAVDTIVLIWTYNSTQMTGFRFNSIYSRLGMISEIEYYSKYLYQNSVTGAFQETILTDSDIINLDTESRNLLYLLTATYAVQQVQGLDAMFFDDQYFQQKYNTALAEYKAQYKSEWQKPKSQYYKMPNASYRNWVGRRFFY